MAEYIEREAAIDYIREQSEEGQKAFEEFGGESGIYADAYNDLAEDFHSIPAADVALVVHGRWNVIEGRRLDNAICSNCGRRFQAYYEAYSFCPNCGAKMDGGDSNESD